MQEQYSNKLSIKKFIFLMIVTFGLYNISWIYNNWKYIKEIKKNNIHVIWRTIGLIIPFYNLWLIYDLFKNIVNLNIKEKIDIKYKGLSLFAIFIAFSVGSRAISRTLPDGYLILSLATGILPLIPLFIAQKYFNNYWEKTQKLPEREWFTKGQIAWIIIGSIFWILVILGSFLNLEETSQINKSIDGQENNIIPTKKTEQIISKCQDKCSEDRCEGNNYIACLMNEEGCKYESNKGITANKCGIGCLSDDNCKQDKKCINQECIDKLSLLDPSLNFETPSYTLKDYPHMFSSNLKITIGKSCTASDSIAISDLMENLDNKNPTLNYEISQLSAQDLIIVGSKNCNELTKYFTIEEPPINEALIELKAANNKNFLLIIGNSEVDTRNAVDAIISNKLSSIDKYKVKIKTISRGEYSIE